MCKNMETDRAKHNILPLSKFGLMQITRQRLRPVTEINTTEKCPLCHGTGKIESTLVIDVQIERILSDLVEKGKKDLTLTTSPILEAYLTKGLMNSFLSKWRRKYKCRLKIRQDTQFSILQYVFSNEKGETLN